MSITVTIRNHRNPRTRTLVAVAALAWLNVVLQPCLMAMPQFVDAAGSYESHISLAANHEPEPEESDQICPHCGSNGACSHTGFAKCDDLDAAKPNTPSKHTDGTDKAHVTIGSVLCDHVLVRTQTALVIKSGKEYLPRPVPIRVVNCVYLD